MTHQIVFNLEDYAGSGGLISSTTNKFAPPKLNEDMVGEEKINIYSDILEQVGLNNVRKIGIQAPPGTKFWFNVTNEDDKNNNAGAPDTTIMIGRTGIYEIEESDVSIATLKFARPVKYVLDTDYSNYLINIGRRDMDMAKIKFDSEISQLQMQLDSGNSSLSQERFWEEYDKHHDTYIEEYESARAHYIQGMAGHYKKMNNDDIEHHNVIIDIQYD